MKLATKDFGRHWDAIARGAVEILPEEDLKKKLLRSIETDTPLRVKAGFDPTAPDLHLGHTVLLHKMRHFQELGHQVIFLIGDFTARIGDPTGRSATRPPLGPEEIEKNAKTYKEQVFKILDAGTAELRYNSEWMDKMGAADMVRLASHRTVARILERDDFEKRYKSGQDIALHEFLYPFIQGYDSVALKADVELGGQDQKFNLLMGRHLQTAYGQEQQALVMMPLLVGLDGVQKMSKSYGNSIGITESPTDMFGKVMSISDQMMVNYYELLSSVPVEEFKKLQAGMASGKLNPKEAKERLAEEIVSRYHGADAGRAAREEFNKVHAKGGVPDEIAELRVKSRAGKRRLVDLLVEGGLAESNADAKRKIKQGGVTLGGERVDDIQLELGPSGQYLVKAGKRHFSRIIFE